MTGKPYPQGPMARIVASNLLQIKTITKKPWTQISQELEALGVIVPPLALRRMTQDKRSISVDEANAIGQLVGLSLKEIIEPSAIFNNREKVLRQALDELETLA